MAKKKEQPQDHECKQEGNIAALQEKYNSIDEKLTSISEAVRGNGQPGIKARLERLQGGLYVAYFIIMILAAAVSVSLL